MRDTFGFNVGTTVHASAFVSVYGESVERISTVDLSESNDEEGKVEVKAAFSDVCLTCRVNPDCDDKNILCGLVAKYNIRASENMKGDSVTNKAKYRKALKKYYELHGRLPFEEQYKFL